MENFYYGLRISIHNILSSVSEETVNAVIRAIRKAGFESLLDLQLVQEKDLMFILKPIPRRKLIKAWREPDIIELNCQPKRIKNEDTSQQIDEFFDEAKNASEYSTYPVKMESITELLKTNICGILNPLSEEILNDIIHALKDAGLELLLDLKFVQEDDLAEVLEPMQRRKLVKAWNQQGNLFHFSSASTAVHQPIASNHNTPENSSAALSLSSSNTSSSIPDLSMLAQRQPHVGSSTSQPLPHQLSPYIDQKYGILPPGPPPEVSYFNYHSSWPPEPAPGVSGLTNQFHGSMPSKHSPGVSHRDQFNGPVSPAPSTGVYSLASIGGESIPPVNLYKLLFKGSKWKRGKCLELLKIYASYKTELSSSSVKENQKVWEKLAEEAHIKSNCLRCFQGKGTKRCSFVSGQECMEKIEELRLQYHANKNENVLSTEMAKFFKTARNVFETTENPVTTSTELPSSASSPNFTWLWKRRVALLRAYTIYKTELSSSNVNEEIVWKKIAQAVGHSPDVEQCRSQIHAMKCEYERMKHSKPYETTKSNQLQTVFLDEAENAFENIENPVVFPAESNLEKWAMNRTDHIKLLKVYEKYKDELLLQNFDVEKQFIWEKVAKEVSKKCCSYYGKRRCCYEINNLKQLYEMFKRTKENNEKKKKKNCVPPYFFYDARRVFESAGQHGDASFINNFTVKQETGREQRERRYWYTHMNI